MSLRTVCSDPCLGSGQRNGSEQKWSGLTERVTLRVRVELLLYFLSHAQKSECKSLWRGEMQPGLLLSYTHSHTVSQAGERVGLEIWSEWGRKKDKWNQRRLAEVFTWGWSGVQTYSGVRRGVLPHLHTHTHTRRHMILPLFPHPSMPHFTWTVSCQNLNALISSTQTYVFIVKDIIWHALKGIGCPKMKMLSSITQPCMTFFLSEFLLDTDWHN